MRNSGRTYPTKSLSKYSGIFVTQSGLNSNSAGLICITLEHLSFVIWKQVLFIQVSRERRPQSGIGDGYIMVYKQFQQNPYIESL